MRGEPALVIATFSRRMRVRLASGDPVEARIKGKRLRPVCGDRVEVEPIAEESDWLITAIHDRDNELQRPNLSGKVEVLAANIEKLIVMAAASPKPDWAIVDRYLCAAELMHVPAAVIYNKTDMHSEPGVDEVLAVFERIGYPTIRVSARTGENVEDLGPELEDCISIIVGQSGVGKSTLINLLVGDDAQLTASISEKRGEGKHTTVNSVMLDLPGGGAVIDSPGVRDYAPALSPDEVVLGYREIVSAAQHCRFANCRHLREPGCAVKAAVEHDEISVRRYDSYRHLLALTEKLTADRY